MLSPQQHILLNPKGAHMWDCHLDIARNSCQNIGNWQPRVSLYLTRISTYCACYRRGVQRQGEENASTSRVPAHPGNVAPNPQSGQGAG
jgi:hypothetical protein